MRRSKAAVYLHFVWATEHRKPLVTSAIEREVYRCIQQEAQRLGCAVLAIGGMPDHVHLAVQTPTMVAPATWLIQGNVSLLLDGKLRGSRGAAVHNPQTDWPDRDPAGRRLFNYFNQLAINLGCGEPLPEASPALLVDKT